METWAFVRGWSVMPAAVSPETASVVNVTIKGAGTGQPGIGRAVTDNGTRGLNATRDSAVTVNPRARP